MPRKGQSAWNKKFGQVARECFKATSGESMRSYGSCMASELKKASPKRKAGAAKRKHKHGKR